MGVIFIWKERGRLWGAGSGLPERRDKAVGGRDAKNGRAPKGL